MSKKLLLIVIFFAFLQVPAQELPPVENFGPNTYTAGNQNWMIAQADNKNLYFANSTGLLEYNGENWNLYPVPNNTIVRSLKIVGDRIYTGAYMEAGYWEENEQGSLEYTSLASKLEGVIGDGEQFWDIEYLDNILIFRSNSGIYFYDPERGSIKKMEIPAKRSVVGIFTVEKQLYFQLAGGGLYKIFNGDPQIVIPQELLGSRTIVHLYFKGNTLHVISGRTEFMMWDKGFLSEESKPVNKEIGNPNILDAINLPNGNIVLGTVGEGVIEIDSNGNIVNAFNQENVLLNNTVLDLFVDKENNLWAGLDYGISSIYLNSSFRSFQDNRGEIGAVYASLHNKDDLYLGTNQGLYIRKAGKDKFQLIPGTNGQVWFIHDIDGQILCGHDEGTFLINGDKAKKIADRLGTWMVKKYTDDILIQGHYNGISFLRIFEGKLEALPKLPDFPHSSKFIEVDDEKNIWISNEHKGVFRLKLGDSLN
ncbi:MAG: histidine kinase, partial [Gramella sp.]|nr:histidine kinase [Christiangramia sp.]